MTRWQLLVYAAAHFGKSLMWQCSGLVFAFYLTEVVGMTPRGMGFALGGSLALNAIMDLGLGWALRRRVQSVRAAGAVQVVGALAASAAFVAFAATALIDPHFRAVAAIVALLAFRIAYSCMDVPQNAILALASTSDADRVRIAAARYAAAGASLILLSLALAPWLAMRTAVSRAETFLAMALIIAAAATAGAIGLFAATRCIEPRRSAEEGAPRGPANVAIPFAFALASILVYSGLMPIFSKLQAYFAAFALQPGVGQWFLACVAAGQLVGQAAWAALGARVGLVALYRIAALALLAAAVLFAVVAPNGGVVVLALGAVFGAASSGLLMAIWAWLAAAANERSETTLRFGAFTFCSKMAQALSASVLGYVLAHVPYQNIEGRGVVVAVMAAAPAAAALICLAIGWGAVRRLQIRAARVGAPA